MVTIGHPVQLLRRHILHRQTCLAYHSFEFLRKLTLQVALQHYFIYLFTRCYGLHYRTHTAYYLQLLWLAMFHVKRLVFIPFSSLDTAMVTETVIPLILFILVYYHTK